MVNLNIGPFLEMSTSHIIFMVMYWLLAITVAILLRNKSKKFVYIMLLSVTLIFTPMELLKFIQKIIDNPNNINSWIDYPFCALFIPSLILSLFKNKHLRKLGLTFLSFGAIIGGFMYITYPGGGIIDYPLFNIKTIYRTSYHFFMLVCGLTILTSKYFIPTLKDLIYYFIFMMIAIIPSLIINYLYNTNLLFLDNPIGAIIINDIYLWNPTFYTIIAITFESTIFYLIGFGIYKLFNLKKRIY